MVRNTKSLLLNVLLLVCAIALSPEGVRAEEQIRIGTLLPETGTAGWVKVAYSGIDLALKEINDAGGPLGRKLVYVKRDTGTVGDKARQGMKELVYDIGVPAIIGPTSITIFNCMDIAQKEHVVQISPTAGTTKLDNLGGNWVFRTTSSDKVMGLAMTAEALILGTKRGAIFCANTGSGISIGDAIKPAFIRLGGEIVAEIFFENDKSSYRTEIQKLLKKKPEVVFWEASPPEAKVFFKELNELGFGGVWIGTDFVNQEFVKGVSAVTNINGIIGVAPSPAPSSRLNKWKQDLKALTGEEGVPPFSAQAYDAMNLIALAIEASGRATGEAIQSVLRRVANRPGTEVHSFAEGMKWLRKGNDIDYIGIAGKVEFDEYGDVMVDHVVSQVKGSQLRQMEVFTQDELAQYAK